MNTTTQTNSSPGTVGWRTFGWSLLLLFLVGLAPTWAQTDRIPVADGAFSNGATFPANGWSVSNGTNHQWIVGSAPALPAPFAGDAAYVTNASPAYFYNTATPSNNYFWRDVTVPAGETAMTLSFNSNQIGELAWDTWQVFAGPTTITPVGSNVYPGSGNIVPPAIAGATFIATGNIAAGIQTISVTVPASFAGTTFRIFFYWKSDTSVGAQPPAAIDNIRLVSAIPAPTNCPTAVVPLNGATNVPGTQILSWSGSLGAPSPTYDVYLSTNSALVTALSSTVRVATATGATTFTPTLLLSTTYFWTIIPTNGIAPLVTSCTVNSFTTTGPANFTATAQGGLWNSTATWVGGVVPGAGNDIIIPAGSRVAVNQILNYRDLTVNGIMEWSNLSFASTFTGNVLVNGTGSLYLLTSGTAGQTINVGGNFTNNGFVNAAAGVTSSATINFNGTSNSSLLGTGTFEGTGGRGVIRNLWAQNAGTFTLNTTQDITATNSLFNTANNFNTNGGLRIDNAVDIFQSAISQAVITNMGIGYTTAPVVFGTAVSPWVASGAALAATRYYVGTNVYVCTVAGTFDVTAPVNTTPVEETNNTASLLWVGNLGNIGNPFQIAPAVAVGNQIFCGDNLYTCTVAGTPSAAAPPTHVAGVVASGTAAFAYVGSVAKVSLNYNGTTQDVRSLNLLAAGAGYSSIPGIIITSTSPVSVSATAVAVLFQVAGPISVEALKATASIFTGATNPQHSVAPAGAAGNGVYSVFPAQYGWFNSAVAIGFSAPPIVNLMTAQGSGYGTTAPTVAVSGGTVLSGAALLPGAFQVNVADGRVISVYCLTPGTTVYSVPPTISLTGGSGTGATIDWGTAYPTATVNLSNGTTGFITSIDVINNGHGYAAAPTVGLRAAAVGEWAPIYPPPRVQQ